jgi:hypothetical protein
MTTLASVILRDTLANRPAAGIAGRMFFDTTNSQLQRDNGSSWDSIEGSTGSGVTASENFLTAPVTIVNANTFYDGPSLSLAAGTYVLTGEVHCTATSARWFTAKLWDGTTQIGGAPAHYSSTAGGGITIPVFGYVVLGSTTTVKISVASDAGASGGTIQDTAPSNGVTDKASHLVAMKIA